MSVFVCGDLHGTIDMGKLNSRRWPEKKSLGKSDILIQLGDFGFVWDGIKSQEEDYWLNWFDNEPYTTYVVPGNHENWDRLVTYPVVDLCDGKAYQISKTVFALIRSGVYHIQGKSFFAFGGAQSIDKMHRVEGKSWWRGEVHNQQDVENALDAIEAHKHFDFIITHTCPQDVANMLVGGKADYCPTSRLFSHIAQSADFEEWHFGHFHEDRELGRYFCHYNNKPMRII